MFHVLFIDTKKNNISKQSKKIAMSPTENSSDPNVLTIKKHMYTFLIQRMLSNMNLYAFVFDLIDTQENGVLSSHL